MKLYITRHGQSIDNENNIIQGPDYNSVLSKQGEQDAKKLANKLYSELLNQEIHQVISSPLERAVQTAQIIADKLRVPVVYDKSLIEFNPGILTGSKDYAINQYPEYFNIWNQRKDLDGIPGAEKGDNLQARALYFLERYFESSKDLVEIVISHAGFNRSLLNTAKLKQRTQPIVYERDRIHVVEEPWQTMNVERLELAKTSQAYKIKTIDQQYVLKRIFSATEDEMQFQYRVSSHLAKEKELLPEILYWGMRHDHSVQILRFLEGNHIYGQTSEKQNHNLLSRTHELGQKLKTTPENLRTLHKNTLKDKIEESIMSLNNSSIKEKGLQLLKNPRYNHLVTEAPQVIVHYDLHRSNILFTEDDEIKILDLGSMVYAPEEFLPASLFMSFFMLEQGENFSLENLLQSWPDKLNKKDVSLLMNARAFIGFSFFEKKLSQSKYLKEDYDIFQKYINALNIIQSKYNE